MAGTTQSVVAQAFTLQWAQLGTALVAVGSLGTAAFGVVESAGKAFAFTFSFGKDDGRRLIHWGLPYVGMGAVNRLMKPLRPALRCAYGDGFAEMIAQQYRSNRSAGSAPDTIRQGVRLGLPFMEVTEAAKLIGSVWRMDKSHADDLAAALQASSASTPAGGGASGGPTMAGAVDPVQALAGRFATALDARVNAAFQLADEQYETVAKTTAGVVAIALAVLFNQQLQTGYPWPVVFAIGLVAVPLAPVAKDLSTSLQNALTAFKSISSKSS